MAGISVQMGVSGIGQFKSAMNQAQQSVKTLDAQLKLNEKQFKASGDSQTYLANKANLLKSQMAAQQTVIKNAEQALKTMASQGVDQASQAYQRMAQQLANAQGAMLDMQSGLDGIGSGAEEAAGHADRMADAVGGIGKKLNIDAIISGLDSIDQVFSNVASRAKQFGEEVWNTIMDSAQRADDSATMAMMYGVDLDTFLRVQKMVADGMDTSVEAIFKSQSKMKNNVGSETKSTIEALDALGVKYKEIKHITEHGVNYGVQGFRDMDDVFWDAGRAIMAMDDAFKQEAYAQDIFGRSWKELVPLFTQFSDKETYNKFLEDLTVNETSVIEDLATMNDKIGELQSNFTILKDEVIGNIAPELSGAADSLSGLLENVLAYLKTEDGQKMLQDLGTAVSGLFDDLGKIDPKEVVKGFTDVFNTIVGGFQWLVANQGTVNGILAGIVGAWGAVKVTGGALKVLQLVNGIKGLSMGGQVAAATAGATAGTSWATGFGSAVKAALPGMLAAVFTIEIVKALPANWMSQLLEKWGLKTPEAQKKVEDIQEEAGIKTTGDAGDFTNDFQNKTGKNAFKRTVDFLLWGDRSAGGTSSAGNGLLQTALEEMFGMGSNAATEKGRWGHDLGEMMKLWIGKWDFSGEQKPEVPVNPVPDTAGLQEQLNAAGISVRVNVIPTYWGDGSVWGSEGGASGGFGGWSSMLYANGLAYVPTTMPAILHKGERVLTAEANRSYTTNSNLYVESMYMNNGMDADALAGAIAARNGRIRAGYGG